MQGGAGPPFRNPPFVWDIGGASGASLRGSGRRLENSGRRTHTAGGARLYGRAGGLAGPAVLRASRAPGVVSLSSMAAGKQPRDEPWSPPVRIVASPQRHRTVSARVVDGVLELRVPAAMPVAERERWAERMRARLERQLRRARPSDEALEERARALNRRHFAGRLRWNSVA